jgi:hypothetical protein
LFVVYVGSVAGLADKTDSLFCQFAFAAFLLLLVGPFVLFNRRVITSAAPSVFQFGYAGCGLYGVVGASYVVFRMQFKRQSNGWLCRVAVVERRALNIS